MNQMSVVALGEILFDEFPSFKRPGGAPANVACICAQFGLDSALVSAVGKDPAGTELLDFMRNRGVDVRHIAETDFSSGKVLVQCGENGSPSYTIESDVAWDHIPWNKELRTLAGRADAVCFGSLAQRAQSAETIHRFLKAAKPDALKVFDVNLRAPFWNAEVLRESIQLANVLKLNDGEVDAVADALEIEPVDFMKGVFARTGIRLVALTLGSNGSRLTTRGESCISPAAPLEKIEDTVGAGDSFTATLTTGLLRGMSLHEIGKHANAVAAFVCSRSGATPELPESLKF